MSVGNAALAATLSLIDAVLSLFTWAIIVGAVLSWLVAFGVINPYNRFVHTAGDLLNRITEPLLAPIRRTLPVVAGGIDLSPLVLLFAIYFLRTFIRYLVV
ncbi:MAG: YggT family protein [Alphaproteobacteria bacterium]|nr:YggT family protein [Alphaproteobacteria bacterium]